MEHSDRIVLLRRLTALLLAAVLLCAALPVFAEESPGVPLWQPLGEFASPPNPRDYLIPTSQSACFSRCGYALDNGLLFVEFRDSGSLYVYYGVDYKVWNEFSHAPSLGTYYNDYIKGVYDCSRVW